MMDVIDRIAVVGSSELVLPPTELEVVFTTMANCAPSRVAEYVVMPSGAIVVLTADDGQGRESFWFDRTGNNPKSFLRRRQNSLPEHLTSLKSNQH